MDRIYWQYANHGVEAWIDTEDGKAWYRFLDRVAVIRWARQHRYEPIEVTA